MKALVVCDSNFGNTRRIAFEIAKSIGGNTKVIPTKDFNEADLKGIDLLIFGSPIIGWRPSETTLRILESLKGQI
jgi:flavodoxin